MAVVDSELLIAAHLKSGITGETTFCHLENLAEVRSV